MIRSIELKLLSPIRIACGGRPNTRTNARRIQIHPSKRHYVLKYRTTFTKSGLAGPFNHIKNDGPTEILRANRSRVFPSVLDRNSKVKVGPSNR